MIDFVAYMNDRTRDFTGREWLDAHVDNWLCDADAFQTLILTGEPGIGKTAYAAHLIRARPKLVAAYHFCAASQSEWIDPEAFARSLALQLSANEPAYLDSLLLQERGILSGHSDREDPQRLAVDIVDQFGETDPLAYFRRIICQPLSSIHRSRHQSTTFILVDGLSEALTHQGMVTIVDLLASTQDLRSPVRFILTTRDEPRVLHHWKRADHAEITSTAPENQRDLTEYVNLRIGQMPPDEPKGVDDSDALGHVVTEASGGNFLYAAYAMDSIVQGSLRSGHHLLPAGLDEVYRSFLTSRIRGDDSGLWEERYMPVLGVLAVARRPLRVTTLADLTGLEPDIVASTLSSMSEFLSVHPGPPQQYALYHESCREFLLDKIRAGSYHVDGTAWNQHIAEFYLGIGGGLVSLEFLRADEHGVSASSTPDTGVWQGTPAPVLEFSPEGVNVNASGRRLLAEVRGVSDDVIRHLAAHPELLYDLAPRKFEELVGELLYRDGYEVTLTPRSRDGGVDIYAAQNDGLGTFLFLVQCKRHAPHRPVTVETIRELAGLIHSQHATAGVVVTTSRFTRDARAFGDQLKFQMSLRGYLELQQWLLRSKTNRHRTPPILPTS